jgi:coiled-coil domain-containing protein 12
MSTLEQQAAERKARLAQLRSLKRKADQVDQPPELPASSRSATPEQPRSDSDKEPKLSGRNYDLEARDFKSGVGVLLIDGEETIELVAEEEKEKALSKLRERETAKLNLDSLQPKKVNWDLKRDLEPQMALLETRTDNAIIRIVRDRLKGMQASGDS